MWSSGGILIKLVDWDPFAIAGARSLIACLPMLVFGRKPKFTFSLDQVAAALSYSATMILFIIANKMTTAANAVLIQYTEPIYIIILGRWLLADEKSTLVDWFVIAGVLGGMVLFFLDKLSFAANVGNLIAVASGVTFALSAIFMRRQKNARPSDSFFLAHIITFIVAVPFILKSPHISLGNGVGLALLGVVQMGIPSLLYARGVRGVSAVSSALITMIEPLFNPLWVALFVGEYPSPRAIIGGAIILACVTVRTVLKAKEI